MIDLKYVLKRISNTALALMLGIKKCNISIWTKRNKVPKKHSVKLKEIRNELSQKTMASAKKQG
jgi:hypothetical protein